MKRNWSALIVVVGTLVGGARFLVRADTQAVLPPAVIEDGNGNPLGPIVGFVKSQKPVIRVIDPANNVPVFLEVLNDSHLRVSDERTLFSGPNCTGTPYHEVPAAEEGLEDISGFMYTVADSGSGQQLLASPTSDGGSGIMYQSQYLNDMCAGSSSGTTTLRLASVVLDLDAAHPPPYTLQ